MHTWSVGALRGAIASAVGILLALGLLGAGLDVAPRIGLAAPVAAEPPRRPPILAPTLPPGADEETALWVFLYRIEPYWGADWGTVIQLLDQFRARYPQNAVALDKLYAAHIEAGRALERQRDAEAARRHYLQASRLDPSREEAPSLLDALDLPQ